MTSSGPLFPASGTNDATIGSAVWSNPGNITVDDGVYASVTIPTPSSPSNYVKGTDYGFTIPIGSTINGIYVEVKAKSSGSASAQDDSVRLVKGGTIVGNDNSAGAAISTGAPVYEPFGSSTDLWGVSWAATDINSSTFGVVYAAADPSLLASTTVLVDAIRITVYYTAVPLSRARMIV